MAIGLRAEIERFAHIHGLKPNLVQAIIQIESTESKYAFRPEPQYSYLWDNRLKCPFRKMTTEEKTGEIPPDDFYDMKGRSGKNATHEWWGQQVSWGYMQVMGAVAREAGFKEIYLTQLFEVSYNLEYGCSLLSKLNRWAGGNEEAMLAAYNGGKLENGPEHFPKRNQAYVDKIQSTMRSA